MGLEVSCKPGIVWVSLKHNFLYIYCIFKINVYSHNQVAPCKSPKRHSYPFCSLLSVLCGYSNQILFMLLQRVVKKLSHVRTHTYTHTHSCALIPEHFQKHPHAEEHITQSLNSQVSAAQNSLPSFMALLYWHNNFALKSLCNFI